MDIEKKIKDSEENYQIKTTAQKIYATYEEKQSQKKRRVFPAWGYALCGLSLALVVATPFGIKAIMDANKSPIQHYETASLKDGSTLSALSIGLITGKNLAGNDMISSPLRRSFADKSEFEAIVNKFNPAVDALLDFYNKEGGMSITYEHKDFTYEGITYTYNLSIEDQIIYTDFDIVNIDKCENKSVLLFLNNNYVLASLDYQNEVDGTEKETELSLSYKVNDEEIIISRESESEEGESGYEFKYKVGSNYSQTFAFEYESGELDVSYELIDGANEYEFNVVQKSENSYGITYGEDTFYLVILDGKKTYTYESYVVIK